MLQTPFGAAIYLETDIALVNDRIELIRMVEASFDSYWPPGSC